MADVYEAESAPAFHWHELPMIHPGDKVKVTVDGEDCFLERFYTMSVFEPWNGSRARTSRTVFIELTKKEQGE